MAIQININTDFNISVVNSYARISYIQGNKDKIDFALNYYKDKESYINKAQPVRVEYYQYVPNMQDNFIKQGYEYLKKLDKFKSAVDLLDE